MRAVLPLDPESRIRLSKSTLVDQSDSRYRITAFATASWFAVDKIRSTDLRRLVYFMAMSQLRRHSWTSRQ